MFFNKSVLPQNTFSKSFPVSTALEVEPQGSSKRFNYEPTKEQMQATWTGLFWLVWPCVPVCLAGFIHICWPGVIINSTTLPKSLVWMMNYTGVLLVTKCTMFDVHCKYRVQITGSAGSLAVGLALQRGETTSEHTGGMWFSEATVLLIPRGRSWALLLDARCTHCKLDFWKLWAWR